MNRWIGIGRLCKDPEIRTTQSGMKVANYRLAVNRPVRAGEHPEADFINCVVFGKGADFVEFYLHKGMKIAVEGRVQTGSYEKSNGTKVSTFDIMVERQEFCESRSAEMPVPVNATPVLNQQATQGFTSVNEDDLPF